MRSALGTVGGDAVSEESVRCAVEGCSGWLQFDPDSIGRLVASCPSCRERARRQADEARRRAAIEERERIAKAVDDDRREREAHTAREIVCTCRCGARIPYTGTGRPPKRCDTCCPPWELRRRQLQRARASV